MARPDIVIVLVPGGMGSSLNLDTVELWNSTADALAMVLDPALFLPWLPLTPGSLVTVYDDFVGYLESLGYSTDQQNLYPFPYDWRQGLPHCATKLAKFVNTQVVPNLAGRKILFIAHSYGCMVTRWAILLPPMGYPINPNLIDRVVAAGPHMLGIPNSFKNLIAMPELNTEFDLLFAGVQILLPAYAEVIQTALCRTLPAVTAMLESMPSNPILLGGANSSTSLFTVWGWGGWPPELQTLIAAVQQNLLSIAAAPWGQPPITVLMTESRWTDTGYILNVQDQLLSALPPAPGDGSVLSQSAKAYCSQPGQEVYLSYPHETLLDDPEGRNFLTTNNII